MTEIAIVAIVLLLLGVVALIGQARALRGLGALCAEQALRNEQLRNEQRGDDEPDGFSVFDKPPREYPPELLRAQPPRPHVCAFVTIHDTELCRARLWLDIDDAWIDESGNLVVRRGTAIASSPLPADHATSPDAVRDQLVELARKACGWAG